MRTLALLLCVALCGCRTGDSAPDIRVPAGPPEATVQHLTLTGPLAARESEVSGMAWHRDRLVFLPQYPSRVGDAVYTLSRSSIDAAIDGSEPTLSPRAVRLAECHFFGGLTIEASAAALDISPSTAKREWRRARAWLHRAMSDDA